ncbi:alpha/beta hydrolase [Allohahella marinimesophila]|uniref:Alpha/beta hydrolase n=1 Tax=Allohahella marinimesophila TaxID=1054972 RepID=A0ABP7NSI3_9GAMM
MHTPAEFQLLDLYARDGCRLALRLFGSGAEHAVVLHLHGSSYNSTLYLSYGETLAAQGFTTYLLDFRGNGDSLGPRGTVAYIGQLEDDVADIIQVIRHKHPHTPIILSGHSAGATVALRYVDKYSDQSLRGLVLMSPVFPASIESARTDFGLNRLLFRLSHWRRESAHDPAPRHIHRHLFKVSLMRALLCKVVPILGHMKTIYFPVGSDLEQVDDRVRQYSFRMMESLTARNYLDILGSLHKPLFLTIGRDDEITTPLCIEAAQRWYVPFHPQNRMILVPETTHLGIVRAAANEITLWLNALLKVQKVAFEKAAS